MSEIQNFNQKVIEEFRANNGVVGGQVAGIPLLLLGTIGAKTGAARTNPLAYLEENDRLIVIASYGGAPKSPPWFHNLVANPEVSVEVRDEKFQATASVLDEPERTELYAKMAEAMPVFNEYQSNTDRTIPVVALTRL